VLILRLAYNKFYKRRTVLNRAKERNENRIEEKYCIEYCKIKLEK